MISVDKIVADLNVHCYSSLHHEYDEELNEEQLNGKFDYYWAHRTKTSVQLYTEWALGLYCKLIEFTEKNDNRSDILRAQFKRIDEFAQKRYRQSDREYYNRVLDYAKQNKLCKKCGRILHLSEFNNHQYTADGHFATCRQCINERRKELRREKRVAKQSSKQLTIPITDIQAFSDDVLFTELKRRGFVGNLTYTKTISVAI